MLRYSETIHVNILCLYHKHKTSIHIINQIVMASAKLLCNDAPLVTTPPLCPLIKITLPGNIFSSQMSNFLSKKKIKKNHSLNNMHNQKIVIVHQE